jgi:phage shock protein E
MRNGTLIITVLLLLCTATFTGAGQRTQQYGVWVRVAELATLLAEKDPVIVDIRTPGEFRTGHLAGAINMPLRTLDRSLGKLVNSHPLLIYCNTVNRVAVSLPIFRENGFQTLYILDGGFTALRESGYPLVR